MLKRIINLNCKEIPSAFYVSWWFERKKLKQQKKKKKRNLESLCKYWITEANSVKIKLTSGINACLLIK